MKVCVVSAFFMFYSCGATESEESPQISALLVRSALLESQFYAATWLWKSSKRRLHS